MKKFFSLILAAVILASFASCGNKIEDPEFESLGGDLIYSTSGKTDETAASEPYDYMANDLSSFIKLGAYTGLTVNKESAVLTDEAFENEIDVLLDSYSYYEEYTDRTVAQGDTVRADYAGYKDGVAFEGGTATDQMVTATPDSGYIAGFAEAFVGRTPGEEFSFEVTFPEDYGNTDLAGQEVTFVCTVHAILGNELIIPELTDEFVNENFGYNNVEEFKIAYRASVQEQNEFYVESNMYSDLWLQIVDNAEVLSYPEEEVERVYNDRKAVYESYASYYGTDYETFLSTYIGLTTEDLYEECRAYVKEDLVMYQLVKTLGITVSEEEYQDGYEFYAEYYGTTVDELISYYGQTTIDTTILWQSLMDKLILESNVVEVE